MLQVYIDGASKNNPGLSGAGFLILEDGWPIKAGAIPLGILTNNKAEYEALIAAVTYIRDHFSNQKIEMEIFTDSQLIIGHIVQGWKIKDHMQPYVDRVKKIIDTFYYVDFNKIPREKNEVADFLSNVGVLQNNGMS